MSLVAPPLATTPVCGATSSIAFVITGSSTAEVSTVNGIGAVGALVLPAGSVPVAVMLCGPSASGVVGVSSQVPSGLTVVVPIGWPLSSTVTVAPGSPLPLSVGRAVVGGAVRRDRALGQARVVVRAVERERRVRWCRR